MKLNRLMLAAIAAASFGIVASNFAITSSPALADRPGTRPVYRPSGSGTTSSSGGTSTGGRPSTSPTRSSAVIKGPSPESRVYVYKQPNSGSETVGYAFDGDPVYVYDSSSNGGTWYYVEFVETGARGWVDSGGLNFTNNRG